MGLAFKEGNQLECSSATEDQGVDAKLCFTMHRLPDSMRSESIRRSARRSIRLAGPEIMQVIADSDNATQAIDYKCHRLYTAVRMKLSLSNQLPLSPFNNDSRGRLTGNSEIHD